MAWVVPRHLAYFLFGRCDKRLERVFASELSEMLKVKDSSLRLRRITNQDGKHAYTLYAKTLPTFSFNHDCCVRDVIGKFLHDQGTQNVSFEKPADASILQYRFEMDNGHMDETQLREKVLKHYMNGNIQIIFIMRHRELPELEIERLKKIVEISKDLFYDKPNRILVACYSEFLADGKLYNQKGEEKLSAKIESSPQLLQNNPHRL